MENHDIIALVYPFGRFAGRALDAIEGNSRLAPSPDPLASQGASPDPHLRIKFSDIPRTKKGVVFGCDPQCDVVVPEANMSNIHFSLTFDDSHRLIVKDLGSRTGTQVTYDQKGEGIRSGFQWIVGGHDMANKAANIVITITDCVAFQIFVSVFDISSPAHAARVSRFNQGTATEDLFGDFGLSKPDTRISTGAQTPGTGEIYLEKHIGQGTFGVVTRLWNVSNGDECVVKQPTQQSIKNGGFRRDIWRQEARLMGRLSHPNIVKLLKSELEPYPKLYLEYAPYGTLRDHNDITFNETLTILNQCLSALKYLHESNPPIAHRDIKPDNILVQNRSKGSIEVKFGDFGLSQDRSELKTHCGTEMYMAPEIHLSRQQFLGGGRPQGYNLTVDIWSLGVMVCELAYDLPTRNQSWEHGYEWCWRIVHWLYSILAKTPTSLGLFLLAKMLVLSPDSRGSAGECFRHAIALLGEETVGFEPLSRGSHPEESQQATLREKDAATVLLQPNSSTNNRVTDLSHHASSVAPTPLTGSAAPMTSAASGAPPASASQQNTAWQQSGECRHFIQNHSSNPWGLPHVGSELTPQFGGEESQSRITQTSQARDDATNPGDLEEKRQADILL
ncbi:protein kinase [Dactylonectria macrodidyma]|uniref:non-specific serine/threonine protein kinase n=1 Tax=Dactylonectria macrodidyma TaxID=307937 RepID=A0A9P9FPQ7_9HYPO|nr:protein kinase [Dactylonectria macrodidyma]